MAIFFYITGFLVSYVVIKEIMKTNWACINSILNRALRLLPSYLFTLMIYYGLYPQFGSGHLWLMDKNNSYNCSPFSKVLLFYDNYVNNVSEMCWSFGWYLNVDMQLYLLSMILLLYYKYIPNIIKAIIWILIIYSIVQLFFYC